MQPSQWSNFIHRLKKGNLHSLFLPFKINIYIKNEIIHIYRIKSSLITGLLKTGWQICFLVKIKYIVHSVDSNFCEFKSWSSVIYKKQNWLKKGLMWVYMLVFVCLILFCPHRIWKHFCCGLWLEFYFFYHLYRLANA